MSRSVLHFVLSILILTLLCSSLLVPAIYAGEVPGSGEVTVKPVFEITDYSILPKEVRIGEKVSASVTINNNDNVKRTFYTSFAVQDSDGNWQIIPYETSTLEPKTIDTVTLYWTVDTSSLFGYYNVKITVWTYEPHKIETKEIHNAFKIETTIHWTKIAGPWEQESDPYGLFSPILEKSVAINPNDKKTIYVGSVKGGGLYQSEDGGFTWIELNEGLPRLHWPVASKYYPITAITIAPSDPNIIYVGTSNPEPYTISFLGVELHGAAGMGIYKSRDGGKTWFPANGPDNDKSKQFPLCSISSMVVNPVNPDIVYVGTIGGGIWKTIDGGMTWKQVWNLPLNREVLMEVNVLAVSPANPNIIYATTYNYVSLEFEGLSTVISPPTLLKSQDGSNFVNEKILSMKVDDIVVDEENANNLYLITDRYRVYRSINGGKDWDEIGGRDGTHPLPLGSLIPGPTIGRLCSIALPPKFTNIIYTSNSFPSYVYFSTDGGQNWYPLSNGLDPLKDHVEKLIFAPTFTPDSSALYAVTLTGLFKIEVKIYE